MFNSVLNNRAFSIVDTQLSRENCSGTHPLLFVRALTDIQNECSEFMRYFQTTKHNSYPYNQSLPHACQIWQVQTNGYGMESGAFLSWVVPHHYANIRWRANRTRLLIILILSILAATTLRCQKM